MDKDKIIKGLEHCRKYGTLGGNDCNGHYEYTDDLQNIIKANNHRKDCPYGQCKIGCVVTLIDNAIKLLKEPETAGLKVGKWCEEQPNSYTRRTYCSVCGQSAPFVFVADDYYGRCAHGETRYTKFCPNCGAKMNDEVESR